ncbi:potassium channel family protein [Ideonella alba]|nr:potassium channel family protein [Ideonella alba]
MSRWSLDTHTFVRRAVAWGLTGAPRDNPAAARTERRWRWPVLLALLLTIPAFYAELLNQHPSYWADAAYLLAAAVVSAHLWQVARRCRHAPSHLRANPTDLLLVAGLLAAAAAPSSLQSTPALVLRMAVAGLTLLRMVWTVQHLITRGGLAYMLLSALGLLLACGFGYWWLEPSTPTLADGLWLAFTTAATVGYGDIVPTTPASRIFSVFVVMLGFGMLSLITAAIATAWVETEERRLEREFLHEIRREMAAMRQEVQALREDLARARGAGDEPPPG